MKKVILLMLAVCMHNITIGMNVKKIKPVNVQQNKENVMMWFSLEDVKRDVLVHVLFKVTPDRVDNHRILLSINKGEDMREVQFKKIAELDVKNIEYKRLKSEGLEGYVVVRVPKRQN